MKTISTEEYLRSLDNPFVRDALGRYDRGEIDYIQALEKISLLILSNDKDTSPLLDESGNPSRWFPENYTIHCDIKLPPCTTIKRGCTLRTLITGIENRRNNEHAPLGFDEHKTGISTGKVTESIFSGETVIIPMAEVHHIERDEREGYTDAISVILNGTTWNNEIDAYNNYAYLRYEEAESFKKCWLQYRAEIEATTLMDISPAGGML